MRQKQMQCTQGLLQCDFVRPRHPNYRIRGRGWVSRCRVGVVWPKTQLAIEWKGLECAHEFPCHPKAFAGDWIALSLGDEWRDDRVPQLNFLSSILLAPLGSRESSHLSCCQPKAGIRGFGSQDSSFTNVNTQHSSNLSQAQATK